MRKIFILFAAVLTLTGCGAADVASPPAPASGDITSSAPAPKAHAKRWVTVATLAGGGNKRGAPFRLGDGDKRLAYTVKDTSGIGAVTVGIYILDKGDSLARSGGFPEVMADQAGKDTTRLAQEAGDYYLDVNAANARWSIKVQEMK